MITDDVIKEIYKTFTKPHKSEDDLQLDYYLEILNSQHQIAIRNKEVVIDELEELNPFRRFLIRSIHTILEFDKYIAFVFKYHILFLAKCDNSVQVHINDNETLSLFGTPILEMIRR